MNYLYNGVELPALPEWDTATYPYAVINEQSAIPGIRDGGYRLYLLGADSYYFEGSDGVYFGGDTNGEAVPGITYDIVDGMWGDMCTHNTWNTAVTVTEYNKTIWSNFDMEYNGTLYLAASDPVPVGGATPETPDPKSMLTAWLVGRRIAKQRSKA